MTRDELGQGLINAASANDISKARQLISVGADVNWQQGAGWTPAMYAAWYGYTDFIDFLIDNNADMGIRSSNGKTAEELARENKKQELANFLSNYLASGSVNDRAAKKNEVTLVSSFGMRTLEETFNFAARERISIVCARPGAPAEAVVREHFSSIVDQSGIEKAFALYKEYGGTISEADVFPEKIVKVRMPGKNGAG